MGYKPGHYIRLNSPNGTWFAPYSTDVTFTATQTYVQPIKELFQKIAEAGQKATEDFSSILAVGGTISAGLSDIFGVKFLQDKYYSWAWKGSEPTQFPITLDFFMGVQGSWDAYSEVFYPINKILSATLPKRSDSGFMLTSPGPAPKDVFFDYVTNMFGSDGKGSISGVTYSSTNNTISLAGENQEKKDITVGTRNIPVWDLSFGYLPGNITDFVEYFTFKNLIVETATPKFSSQLQKKDEGYYPISGSIDLTLKSQSLLVSSGFQMRAPSQNLIIPETIQVK